jgi:ADP-ribose pyrophosphatase
VRTLLSCAPWFTVVSERIKLPNGKEVDDYYRIDAPPYALVYALTDDNRVLTHWSYRHGPRRVVLGLPGGYLSDGEDPLEGARRELLEETGAAARDWTSLGSFVADSNRGSSTGHLFLARGARFEREPNSGDLEDNELELMPQDVLLSHLQSGSVGSMGNATAISLGLFATMKEQDCQ